MVLVNESSGRDFELGSILLGSQANLNFRIPKERKLRNRKRKLRNEESLRKRRTLGLETKIKFSC